MQGALPQLATAANSEPSGLCFDSLVSWKRSFTENLRPWRQFFDAQKLSKPSAVQGTDLRSAQGRLNHNVVYFRANYMIVTGCLAAYKLLTNIWLLLCAAFVASGLFALCTLPAGVTYQVRNNLVVTKQQLLIGWSLFSLVLFVVSGAGSAFFWILGCSGMLTGVHAALREVEPDSEFASLSQIT